jgi:hypothetical protein
MVFAEKPTDVNMIVYVPGATALMVYFPFTSEKDPFLVSLRRTVTLRIGSPVSASFTLPEIMPSWAQAFADMIHAIPVNSMKNKA